MQTKFQSIHPGTYFIYNDELYLKVSLMRRNDKNALSIHSRILTALDDNVDVKPVIITLENFIDSAIMQTNNGNCKAAVKSPAVLPLVCEGCAHLPNGAIFTSDNGIYMVLSDLNCNCGCPHDGVITVTGMNLMNGCETTIGFSRSSIFGYHMLPVQSWIQIKYKYNDQQVKIQLKGISEFIVK